MKTMRHHFKYTSKEKQGPATKSVFHPRRPQNLKDQKEKKVPSYLRKFGIYKIY